MEAVRGESQGVGLDCTNRSEYTKGEDGECGEDLNAFVKEASQAHC